MQRTNAALIALLLAPACFGAPSKEMIQLQRDLAQLQDQVRQLQSAVSERLAALTTLVQQGLDTSSKTNTSVAVLESGLRDRLSQQLSAPITGVSTKVDQMSTEFQTVRENVSAMNETLSKLQSQLIDINNTLKIMQTPAAPPPSAAPQAAGSVPGSPSAAAGPPPGMSAKQLYDTALQDRSRGNLDLAQQGFEQYLQWYANSELAPNAQYYIGQGYYDRNDFANAIRAFDAVLERFGENNKSADAMYMKGMSLLKSGQRTQAAQEFLTVIQKYPRSEVADKARNMRKSLGLSVPSAAAGKPAAAPHRRR